jgi:hypothetical protein
LEEEKDTLEGMVESRDELLLEITRETGLDYVVEVKMLKRKKRMPTTEEMPLLPHLRRSTKKARWRQSLSNKPQCRMKSSWHMLSLRCRSFICTMHS